MAAVLEELVEVGSDDDLVAALELLALAAVVELLVELVLLLVVDEEDLVDVP
ncbi:hypothetical protein ABTQ33_06650 [Paucilactobacillus suebicus]|uniref:hypothetical protein n=1 Tax=Paucilactobacillus suebicus TaxID=152335 RepID=UPI0002F64353